MTWVTLACLMLVASIRVPSFVAIYHGAVLLEQTGISRPVVLAGRAPQMPAGAVSRTAEANSRA